MHGFPLYAYMPSWVPMCTYTNKTGPLVYDLDYQNKVIDKISERLFSCKLIVFDFET